jgi:hypothetical protein
MTEITKYELGVLDVIISGKGMGQMLRELPAWTSSEELQKYAMAYDQARQ